MQQLQTVDADTLLYEPLEKPSFVVDGLTPPRACRCSAAHRKSVRAGSC